MQLGHPHRRSVDDFRERFGRAHPHLHEHLMAYEARLNFFIPGKPWISICLYNVTKFDGGVILNVLRTHPWVLNQGVLTENPYFQEPTDWLSRHAPEFLPPR